MIKNFLFVVLFILLVQCGFKVVDTSLSNLSVKKLDIDGYNKVNFLIKNDLLNKIRGTNSSTPVNLRITTKRKKEISEKNIRNEITKYKIILNTRVEITRTTQEKLDVFDISTNGDYRVETSSIKTLKNLDNLEKKLSNEISKEIKQKLFFLNNDL
jgi:hypothetical protein